MKTAPLFRGKSIDNGKMVEGYYYAVNGYAYIHWCGEMRDTGFRPMVRAKVDPDTVEQIAGDIVEENTRLRDELDRLKDVVCEEDVYSIEEALKENER